MTAIWDHLGAVGEDHVTTVKGRKLQPDVLVLATGFDLSKGPFIAGRKGYDLHDRQKIECYHGATAAGFPNFFMILGANVASGHSSICFYAEVQAEYIAQCIVGISRNHLKAVEVKQSASDDYNAWLDVRLKRSVWNNAKSYYRADGGKGKIFVSVAVMCLHRFKSLTSVALPRVDRSLVVDQPVARLGRLRRCGEFGEQATQEQVGHHRHFAYSHGRCALRTSSRDLKFECKLSKNQMMLLMYPCRVQEGAITTNNTFILTSTF